MTAVTEFLLPESMRSSYDFGDDMCAFAEALFERWVVKNQLGFAQYQVLTQMRVNEIHYLLRGSNIKGAYLCAAYKGEI